MKSNLEVWDWMVPYGTFLMISEKEKIGCSLPFLLRKLIAKPQRPTQDELSVTKEHSVEECGRGPKP